MNAFILGAFMTSCGAQSYMGGTTLALALFTTLNPYFLSFLLITPRSSKKAAMLATAIDATLTTRVRACCPT
jgi:hypothetical protein